MATLSLALLQSAVADHRPPRSATTSDTMGPDSSAARPAPRLPLRFEANQGQTDSEVRFLSRGAGSALFLTPTEFVLRLTEGAEGQAQQSDPDGPAQASRDAVLRMRLAGANPHAELVGRHELPGRANYMLGDDRSRWLRGVPSYARVAYRGVYPGIDLVFHADRGRPEYDFIVAPGADPSRIAVVVKGASRAEVGPDGDLLLDTAIGTVRQPEPVIYQQVGGRRRAVSGGYTVASDGQVGFWVGAYDHRRPLVIDPVLPYSTFLGGTRGDGGNAIAFDRSGNAYVTGWTSSADFPQEDPPRGESKYAGGDETNTFCHRVGRPVGPPGRLRPAGHCGDVFVAKLNADGTELAYTSYIGGRDAEAGNGIAVDASGHPYLTGYTMSTDFPGASSFGAGPAGRLPNAFVAKLDPTGTAVLYSAVLGGPLLDSANAIAVDASGKAYVTGEAGPGLMTKNAFQPSPGDGAGISSDAFVTKVDPSASGPASLVYSTYLGGPGADVGYGIAIDSSGNAYVAGVAGPDFPVRGAFQRAGARCGRDRPGGVCPDAFVTKLNPEGSALVYATYLGGVGDDAAHGIAVDSSGAAYLAGSAGLGFPVKNGFQRTVEGGADAFVAKLDRSGSKLAYSTPLGGAGEDAAHGIAVDSDGHVHVTGITQPSHPTQAARFPTKDALQSGPTGGGDADGFVATLKPEESGPDSLEFSTYLGGGGDDDWGNGIAVNASGTAYVTGFTESFSDFPTTNALQLPGKGGGDGFVAKVSPVTDGRPVVTKVEPASGPPAGGTRVVITGTGFEGVRSVSFGRSVATDYAVSADGTRITVRSPARADEGPVVVSVTTAKGAAGAAPGARFDYAEGAWRSTGAPTLARLSPSAVLLQDGKVLLAGGCVKRERPQVCSEATASSEVYDPTTEKWAPTGEMTTARHSGHTATLLPDGKVLVVGGVGPAGVQLSSAEVYDPASGRWSATAQPTNPVPPRPGSMRLPPPDQTTPRSTATLLKTGKVLVVGALSAEIYDPSAATWTPTGDRRISRSLDHTATLLPDGKVLVVGFDQTASDSAEGGVPAMEQQRAAHLYDPATGSWLPAASPRIPRYAMTASLLPGGQVLLTGGQQSPLEASEDAELYDPNPVDPAQPGVKGRWRAARSLAVGRYGHAAVTLASGKVLVTGGAYSDNGRLATAEVYDAGVAGWKSAGVMSSGRGAGVTATLLPDGTVLVVGSGTKSAELYDPNPSPDRGPLDAPGGSEGGSKRDATWWLVGGAVAVVLVAAVAIMARRRRA